MGFTLANKMLSQSGRFSNPARWTNRMLRTERGELDAHTSIVSFGCRNSIEFNTETVLSEVTVNRFLDDLRLRIDQLNTRDDLRMLYEWIWDNKTQVSATAAALNAQLGLSGDKELKPDLPCLSVGSTTGLVVLAANPGWKPDLNAKEDGYCQQSREAYVDMMFNFYHRHPLVRDGVYSRWWTQAMKWQVLLSGWNKDEWPKSVGSRWERVHESGRLGGWELFPWHSSKDGITSKIHKHACLAQIMRSSVRALLRLKPQVLFVASSTGYGVIRHDLLPDLQWRDFKLSGSKCAYARTTENTEIVAIKLQILGGAFRKFKDKDLIAELQQIRAST